MKQVQPGSKKLTLNKQVVSVLSKADLQNFKGGNMPLNSDNQATALDACTGRPTLSTCVTSIILMCME